MSHLKSKLTKEQIDDVEMNWNNAMRGEDNYDEMTEEIEEAPK